MISKNNFNNNSTNELDAGKSKREILALFRNILYHEYLLFQKCEKIKQQFRQNFSTETEEINFVKHLFESVSSYNKALETRGYDHYIDPKYMIGKGNSRYKDQVLDLKKFNEQFRQKNNFPVITYKELRLLSSYYNLNDGDSIYMQEFMFIFCSSCLMFKFLQNVNN